MRQWLGSLAPMLASGLVALAVVACSSGPSATIIDNTAPSAAAPVTTGTTPVAFAAQPATNDPSNTLILELKTGKVTIRLRPDLPHPSRFRDAASEAGTRHPPDAAISVDFSRHAA